MDHISAADRAVRVRAIADAHREERGPLLPALHAVVAEFGYVDRGDVETLADAFNLSVAEVHGVVSFYHDFRTSPPPAHTVALCRAEACQAVGGEALHAAVSERIAGRGDVALVDVYCLGNCALGPSGTLDGRLRGRLTADAVMERLR